MQVKNTCSLNKKIINSSLWDVLTKAGTIWNFFADAYRNPSSSFWVYSVQTDRIQTNFTTLMIIRLPFEMIHFYLDFGYYILKRSHHAQDHALYFLDVDNAS